MITNTKTSNAGVYVTLMFLFGGIGLFAGYVIANKMRTDEDPDEDAWEELASAPPVGLPTDDDMSEKLQQLAKHGIGSASEPTKKPDYKNAYLQEEDPESKKGKDEPDGSLFKVSLTKPRTKVPWTTLYYYADDEAMYRVTPEDRLVLVNSERVKSLIGPEALDQLEESRRGLVYVIDNRSRGWKVELHTSLLEEDLDDYDERVEVEHIDE